MQFLGCQVRFIDLWQQLSQCFLDPEVLLLQVPLSQLLSHHSLDSLGCLCIDLLSLLPGLLFKLRSLYLVLVGATLQLFGLLLHELCFELGLVCLFFCIFVDIFDG